ncbi:NucA/NucB deoxyribonuclease domain-containing protein [Amycolatopsis sp. GA6-003]|uniref:NucA/NucB deoxyribonuclease domain-containing protein n=1 Tax=Amycolatopsis sp. GA6-003 TaxID=2652444 RepID=UPI0039176251
MSPWHIDSFDVETGAITGGIDVAQVGYVHSDPDLIDWQYEATQTFANVWGSSLGTTVTGRGWCEGDCRVTRQNYPTMAVLERGIWEDYVVGESTTYQPGDVGSGILNAETTFTNPGWVNSVSNSGPTPAARCDNMLPGRGAGCVLSAVTPEMFYRLDGPYPELAKHIQKAQAKGLPGARGGTPLQRATEDVVKDRNRAVACPDSLPRPEGKDCDEYPFASTWEGAAFGPYDVEMINSWQNQQGGSALSDFYDEERVLNLDPFWVTIV